MNEWVKHMQPKLEEHRNGQSSKEQSGRKKPSIFKVPSFISTRDDKNYQPRVVSFGPYHHKITNLEPMEAHKERALLHYIGRSKKSMQDVFSSIEQMALELQESYDSLDTGWKDKKDEFVQMMILDGCFMLEVLYSYYSEDDPVFSRHGDIYVLPFIKADMLLLENQLPMSLLFNLKCILDEKQPNIEDLNKQILWFLNYNSRGHRYPEMGQCLHVLDLYRKGLLHTHNEHGNAASQPANQGEDDPEMGKCWHKIDLHCNCLLGTLHCNCLLSTRNKPSDAASQSPDQGGRRNKRVGHNVVRPATELREAGVRFMKRELKSLRDITFDVNSGVLELPNFIVDDYTKSIFLNLIAFERCYIPAGSDITSFVAFMDRIIDDSQDIKFLSSKGIISNFIGSDEKAADLFNVISTTKDLDVEMNDELYEVYEKLIDYSNKDWNKWRANLCETHFRNPWTTTSIIAASLLLSLTAIQTIFTILN